jgi:hypothetical protein
VEVEVEVEAEAEEGEAESCLKRVGAHAFTILGILICLF